MVPLIALEEHFLDRALYEGGHCAQEKLASFSPIIDQALTELNGKRLADMDAHSIAIQVISHLPVSSPLPVEAVQQTNQKLHRTIQDHPSRFAGLALLNMHNAIEAAEELERTVTQYGFKGAVIGNTLDDGTFYDSGRFDALFAKAEALDVPLYIHPIYPSQAQDDILYNGPWDARMQMNLACWCWGWHALTGLHILRLYAANVFERFPRLQIVIGHMGEMIPFMIDRILPFAEKWPGAETRTKTFQEVWDHNLWITTSGMFSLAPMACLLQTTRKDRIMFSTDYPFAANKDGKAFIDQLAKSGLVTTKELEGIAYKNAERLLKVHVSQT